MKHYPYIFTPMVVHGRVLKNRLAMSRAIPTFTVGVEDEKPMASALTYVGDMAAAGASIVPLPAVVLPNPHTRPMQMPPRPFEMDDEEEGKMPKPDDGLPTEKTHNEGVDLSLRNNRIFYARMASAVHSYGALCSMGISDAEPRGWDISDVPLEVLEELPDRFARAAADYASLGVDVMNVHMSYGGTLLCRSLSRRNRRTDKYGGETIEERARLTLEVFQRVKAVCPDCVLQVQISGEESGAYTTEDLCRYVKLWEGLVDLIQLRGATDAAAHPSGVNSVRGKPVTLEYAKKLKASGTSIPVGVVGGYGDPELIESALKNGDCDLVYMSRALIAEPDYAEKLLEGRGEDVTPCLLCNKCHVRPGDPDFGCSVNPRLALSMDPNFRNHVKKDPQPKKVAVIGGGPAGMTAAITAARRGHAVTLYEASGALGGQLRHAEFVDFKWPLLDYMNYLIAQTEKAGVEVRLHTPAKPERMEGEGYDVILYAAGAAEKLPPVEGIETVKPWKPMEVFGRETELGERVLVIGGSETGVETAWHLALCGHQVTELSRRMPECFFKDADRYRDRLAQQEGGGSLTQIPKVKDIRLSEGQVSFTVKKEEKTVLFDDVVVCGGVSPVREDLEALSRCCARFRVIGDSFRPGDVRTGVKDAYAAAMLI